MEQHLIPQNVTTFQFRLIGDMTLKQFGYLAGGGILAYIAYKLPLPFFFTWPLTALFAFGGIGFAFVPVEERPMDVWFLSFIKSVYSPTQYVWQKNEQMPEQHATTHQPAPAVSAQVKQTQQTMPAPTPHIQEPTKQTPVSHDEKVIQQTVVTSGPIHQSQKQPSNPITSAVPKHLPRVQLPIISFPALFAKRSKALGNQGIVNPPTQQHPPKQVANNQSLTGSQPVVTGHSQPVHSSVVHHQTPRTPWSFSSLFGFGKKKNGPQQVKPRPQVVHAKNPSILPAPPSVFPKPKTTSVTGEHLSIDTNTLQDKPTTSQQPTPQGKSAQEIADDNQKLHTLESQLQTMKGELDQKTLSESRILELQKQLTDVLAAKQNLEKQVVELTKKSSHQAASPPQPVRQAGVVSPQQSTQPSVRVITPDAAVRSGLPRLTTFPNVVTGIIKDYSGNLLPGVLVIVRDKDDIPVRALKSNKLGQFAASTPLTNGVYTVDIEDPKSTYVFDRIQTTLNGGILPPLEIIAKSRRDIERDQLAKQVFSSPNT